MRNRKREMDEKERDGAGRFVDVRFAKLGDISDKNFKVEGLERHDIALFVILRRSLCVLTIRKTNYTKHAQNGSKRLLNAF